MPDFRKLGQRGVSNIDMIVNMAEANRAVAEVDEQSRSKITAHIKDAASEYMTEKAIANMTDLNPVDAQQILALSFKKALADKTLDQTVVNRLVAGLSKKV